MQNLMILYIYILYESTLGANFCQQPSWDTLSPIPQRGFFFRARIGESVLFRKRPSLTA